MGAYGEQTGMVASCAPPRRRPPGPPPAVRQATATARLSVTTGLPVTCSSRSYSASIWTQSVWLRWGRGHGWLRWRPGPISPTWPEPTARSAEPSPRRRARVPQTRSWAASGTNRPRRRRARAGAPRVSSIRASSPAASGSSGRPANMPGQADRLIGTARLAAVVAPRCRRTLVEDQVEHPEHAGRRRGDLVLRGGVSKPTPPAGSVCLAREMRCAMVDSAPGRPRRSRRWSARRRRAASAGSRSAASATGGSTGTAASGCRPPRGHRGGVRFLERDPRSRAAPRGSLRQLVDQPAGGGLQQPRHGVVRHARPAASAAAASKASWTASSAASKSP